MTFLTSRYSEVFSLEQLPVDSNSKLVFFEGAPFLNLGVFAEPASSSICHHLSARSHPLRSNKKNI